MSQPVPSDIRVQAPPLISEERDWAARVRAGDAAAFERAFRTYHAALCKFACRYVHSPEIAEELVHDVFARLWEERARLSGGRLKSYLYTAVRNLAVSHLRHQLVERRWREPTAAVDVNEGERRLESAELEAAVERLLHRLPERCRLALTLRWRRQMSYAEVARAMGISVKTVEIYVGRGLAVLRESYQSLAPHR